MTATQQLMAQEPFFQQAGYYGADEDTGEPKEQPFRGSSLLLMDDEKCRLLKYNWFHS